MAEIKHADEAAEQPEDPRPNTAPVTSSDARPSSSPAVGESWDTKTREEKEEQESRLRRFVGSTPFLIIVALFVAILVKTFVIQAFYIPSESMVPTLEVGDRVFVSKFMFDGGDVARGDVIVFENPHPGEVPDRGIVSGFFHWLGEGIGFAQPENEDFIKRVIALPGETIEARDGVVAINNERILDERWLPRSERRLGSKGAKSVDIERTTLDEDEVYVLGDNRDASIDSRSFGPVSLERVVGRSAVRVWPPSRFGTLDWS